MSAPKVSVVIPAYNEAGALPVLLGEIRKAPSGYEILVVDDGSTDQTGETLKSQGVRVIRHPYNMGYGASLKTGIRHASADIVAIMDADGQHTLADVQRLVAGLEDYEMVVGARTKDSQTSPLRKPFKVVLGWVAIYLSGTRIPDLNSGLRVFRRKTVEEFLPILPNGFSFSTTSTLAYLTGGYPVSYVPIRTAGREGRASNVRMFSDGFNSVLLIIRTIALFNPLRVFLPVAVFLLLLGGGYLAEELIRTQRIPGGAVLTVLAGILTFFFGILADQISLIRKLHSR
ncbi:MAG: glycosyltransferase family 2 protein [Myxococcota bacterium]